MDTPKYLLRGAYNLYKTEIYTSQLYSSFPKSMLSSLILGMKVDRINPNEARVQHIRKTEVDNQLFFPRSIVNSLSFCNESYSAY